MPRTRSRANKIAAVQTASIFSKVLDDTTNKSRDATPNKRKSTGDEIQQYENFVIRKH
jgi:hypothetical protein